MISIRKEQVGDSGDERWVAACDGKIVADLTLWWSNTPSLESRPVGFIGRYSAADRAAAQKLLGQALLRLASNGCAVVVGPVDGSTWHGYRFVVDRGNESPFFLEPQNPDEWPADLVAAGFEVLASYRSHRDLDLRTRDPRSQRLQAHFEREGVALRPLRLSEFEREMTAVYQLSIRAFAQNLLYSPICAREFMAMYAEMRPLLDERLCIMAEREGELVGFAFAIRDALDASGKTAIIKTVARDPHRRYAGLGPLLSDRIRLAVHKASFESAIHALMHESNTSLAISRRFGRPMRRYALFWKALA